MPKKRARKFNCATEFTLDVLGGKWKTVILCYLKQRPCRYAELRKLVPNLSDKVLTERLHDLVEGGLVARTRETGNGRAEFYTLTARGQSLGDLLAHLYDWGLKHAEVFGVHVGDPLERLKGV